MKGIRPRRLRRAIDEMKAITGGKGYYVGMAVQNKSLTENVESEMNLILTVAVIMIFAVLCLTTSAWSEPFLFPFGHGRGYPSQPGHQYFHRHRVIPDQ